LSYDQILQVDTGLAESVLKSLDPETGSVMPPNLLPGKFVHFSADNIDILDETMDGKNTFHATQIATWQRGAESNLTLENLKPSPKHILFSRVNGENLSSSGQTKFCSVSRGISKRMV